MAAARQWVVVAWTVEVGRWNHAEHRVGSCREARACTWLQKGTDADVVKAQAHMDSEHPETGKVFTFPLSEQEPLVRARKLVLS